MRSWPKFGLRCAPLVVCVVTIASCGRDAPALEDQYRRALQLVRAGDFDAARELAESAERASGDNDLPMRCRFRLVRIEALMDGDKPQEADKLLSSPPHPASPEYDVRARIFRARRAVSGSDFQTAMRLATEAQVAAQQLSRSDLQAEAEVQMGALLARQRQYSQADEMLQRASATARKADDIFRHASASNNLGLLRMLRSRCEEAIKLFDTADTMWRGIGATYWSAIARGNAGICYGQLGDYDKSLALRRESVEQRRPGVHKANALGEMARLLFTDDPQKAIPYFQQARDMSRQFGARPDAARWASNLTLALTTVGDWAGAERALAEAIALGPESRSRAFLDLNAAAIAVGKGRVQEGRELYERIAQTSVDNPAVLWSAHAGAAGAWVAAGNFQAASVQFDKAIGVIENAWSHLNADDYKITFLGSLIGFYQSYVDALITQGDTEKALAVADRSRARLLAQRLSTKVTPHAPADFRKVARDSRSVWISYWLAPRRSFAWVVTPTSIHQLSLPPAAEVETLVREYRGFIETNMRDPIASPSEAGRKLYDKLIAPALPYLSKDADVIIVPDGALHQLSFDTLPVYSTPARYLVNDYSLAVAPSLGVYRGRREPETARDALIVGDPISPGPEFPVLPHAGAEIDAVQKRLRNSKTTVITGGAARPDVWTSADPGRYSLIHIAAHAEANEKNPLLSAIVLSPSPRFRLFARDMVDVPLRANLVTISACRSSGARAYRGEGLVGFAWTFLQAGSRSVIAGLWDVADESTSLLMDRLYEGIARKQSPARSLRAARIALQQTAWSKPYYWGPFQCYIR
ncbi:MAG TPA: CHAT domain-containing tetratricopeptide repeat protein [Bryobacteraceae bacterium]|nr:CHAT domain-containing tetratricopeptide repeat protein [Bryobacteraceae bacterium]